MAPLRNAAKFDPIAPAGRAGGGQTVPSGNLVVEGHFMTQTLLPLACPRWMDLDGVEEE